MSIPLTEGSLDQRLKELNFQAAKGRFGEPVRFLAGVEIEFQFIDSKTEPADSTVLEQTREDLSHDLDALESKVETDEDQATLDLWREQLPSFNAQDLLNGLVYMILSKPTLRPGRRPPADDYDSVLAHTKAVSGKDALDFRFGKKPYFYSYYDHPQVSEFSILPVRPMQLYGKAKALTDFVAEHAIEYGCGVASANKDLAIAASIQTNLSAYRQVETEEGIKWMPVIGRDPSLRSTTGDAMAGLTMGIEDGAWFSSLLGRVNHNLTGKSALRRDPFTVGVARSNDIRINHQWVENRSPVLQNEIDLRHNLLWMMSAITYGLEHGADTIGSMPNRIRPELRPTVVTTRTENFDGRVDGPLRQMLQSCSIINGRLRPDAAYAEAAGGKFTEALIDRRLSPRAAALFAHLFIGGLRLGEHGELHAEEAAIVAPQLLLPSDRKVLKKSAQTDDVESLFAAAAIRAEQAGFHSTIRETLHSTANYPALTSDEWVKKLSESEIFRRAHGPLTEDYAALLGQAIKKNPYTKDD